MMNLTGFENCCGIDILSDLGGKQVDLQKTLTTLVRTHIVRSLVVAATSEEQPGAEEFLKAKGFKIATTFANRNSGNKVTLWYLNTNGKKLK